VFVYLVKTPSGSGEFRMGFGLILALPKFLGYFCCWCNHFYEALVADATSLKLAEGCRCGWGRVKAMVAGAKKFLHLRDCIWRLWHRNAMVARTCICAKADILPQVRWSSWAVHFAEARFVSQKRACRYDKFVRKCECPEQWGVFNPRLSPFLSYFHLVSGFLELLEGWFSSSMSN